MKKSQRKKLLSIVKETVRSLQGLPLENVRGGLNSAGAGEPMSCDYKCNTGGSKTE